MSRFQVAKLPELRLQMETAQTLVKNHISFVVMPCETREDFEQAVRDQARRLERLAAAAEDVKVMALPKPIKLLETHQDVLQALFEAEMNEAYFSVSSIAINLGRTKNDVRLICRSLKRKGLAKQVAWHDDDGYICGSGYGITPKGVEYARARGWKGGE